MTANAAAAVAPSSPAAVSLLDLQFLTDEERVKIESVLRADEELRTRDRVRLGCVRVRGGSVAREEHAREYVYKTRLGYIHQAC